MDTFHLREVVEEPYLSLPPARVVLFIVFIVNRVGKSRKCIAMIKAEEEGE